MGILNGLLTGGIIVGKICQALGGAGATKQYTDKASGVTVLGEVSTGGVRFFRSNVGGQSIVHAFNPNTTGPAVVSVPNDPGADGVSYVIQPTEKVPFAEAESPQVSPSVDVTAGLTNPPPTSQAGVGAGPSLFKLAFSGLKLNGWAKVGSFRVSCTTSQLVIVSSAITANSLAYMWLCSNRGVSVTNQNRIPPSTSVKQGDGDVEQRFNVDFSSLGIDINNDTIDGQLTLEINATGKELSKLSKVPSQPLHPAEKEFFARLDRGEL